MRSIRGKLKSLKKSPFGEENYDSLLERDYMIELEQNPSVKSWTKKHNIKIPYKFLRFFNKNYLPDFLVENQDGTKEIHEGKGLPLLFWGSTTAKRKAAEEYCEKKGWKYKIITHGKQVFYKSNFVKSHEN
ncbi:MAG: TnsA endonuclease N-terminal domain-containing protein [Patescibacteria group bacterium]